MTIEFAALIDLLHAAQFPGADPWALEKLSYTNWEKYGKSGLRLLAGAGVATLFVGAVVSSATTSLLAGGAEAEGAAGGGAALLTVIPVAALMDITVVAIVNHNNKAKVQAEFQRRRLSLPFTVPAGTAVTGSLFFPMTPGPQQLVLTGHAGGAPVDLTLNLSLLKGLHLKHATP